MDEQKHGMQASAAKRRIDRQCAIYMHKPTGKRFYVAFFGTARNELHGVDGGYRYATDEELENTEIWSKHP